MSWPRQLYRPPPPAAPDTGWEELLPDYSNVHGLNFVPVYPSLWANPPDLPPPLVFRGTASPVAQWRFWQSNDVDMELGYLRGIGCNALRVFLSFEVWEYYELAGLTGEENPFIQRFADLVALCEKHRIYLMPVIWNQFATDFQDPSAEPFNDISSWRRSPGTKNANLEWAKDHRADDWVAAVVAVARDSRALLMWDVMNEPDPLQQQEWLEHYAELVRELDPNPEHKVTIGFAALLDFGGFYANPLVDNPAIDVLSYHPYGPFRQNVEEWTRLARRVAEPPFVSGRKPILASEGGFPGGAQSYPKQIDYVRSLGVGSLLYNAMIDDPRSALPFQDGSGFFYADGQVRDEPAAQAFRTWSLGEGVLEWQLAPVVEKTDLKGFTRYYPFAVGYDIDALIHDLDPNLWPLRPRLSDGNVTTDGYIYQNAQIGSALIGLVYFLSQTYARGILTVDEEATVRGLQSELALHDLLSGPQLFLDFGPPLRIDWPRYDALFTRAGLAIREIVVRHGFGG